MRDAVGKGADARPRRAWTPRRGDSTSRPAGRRRRSTRGCLREEIFGPVAPVIGFADEEAAIAAANDTEFGLVADAHPTSSARSGSSRAETGMVGLNQGLVQPRGAVRRRQGLGLRPRGRQGGDRRVPRDQVRGDGDVGRAPRSGTSLVRPRPRRGRRGARGRGARDRDAGRAPSVRMVLVRGIDGRRRLLLHQPGEPQGPRAGGEPARGDRDPLASARAPDPAGGTGRAALRRGVRRLLREPSVRQPAERVGLGPEQRAARLRDAERRVVEFGAAIPRRSRARSTGAATGCAPTWSSSGRAVPTGCTTASATSALPTAGARTGSRPDAGLV